MAKDAGWHSDGGGGGLPPVCEYETLPDEIDPEEIPDPGDPDAPPGWWCQTSTIKQHLRLNHRGAAKMLSKRHGDVLRHVHGLGWIAWDGRVWTPDSHKELHYVGKIGDWWEDWVVNDPKTGNPRRSQIDDGVRTAVIKWAANLCATPTQKSVLEQARGHMPTPVDKLDAKPYLMAVANGTIDLKTGRLLPHRRQDMLTMLCSTKYVEGAMAPRWDKFLREILPDDELRRYVQILFGMALIGKQVEEIFIFLYGMGANGKSVFLRVLHHVLGPICQGVDQGLVVERRNAPAAMDAAASLRGVRLAVCGEPDEGARMAEGTIKLLTGGDTTIKAQKKFRDSFDLAPVCTLVMHGNHRPTIRGQDDGIWRRVKVVPFEVQIPKDQRDPHLSDKLIEEAPGILRWLVDGCLIYQSTGLRDPEAVEAVVTEYREDMDIIGQFLEECCVQGTYHETDTKLVYQAFKDWSRENGAIHVDLKTKFTQKLGARGIKTKRAHRDNKYVGIDLALEWRRRADEPADPEWGTR
jgi:putative DNA primase/helicase